MDLNKLNEHFLEECCDCLQVKITDQNMLQSHFVTQTKNDLTVLD